MRHLAFAALFLVGCVGSGATPPDDPACAPELFEPSGNEHLITFSNYVGFAGDWGPERTIHRDGHVTSVYYGGELETPALGEARVAQLVEELRESDAIAEREGCYEGGGSLVPAGPDSGCGLKVTLQLDGTVARFSGCGVPDTVRAAYDAAYRYELEARSAAED